MIQKIKGLAYFLQNRDALLKEFVQDLSDLMHAQHAKAQIEKEIYVGQNVAANMRKLEDAQQVSAVRYGRIVAKAVAVFRLQLPYKEPE